MVREDASDLPQYVTDFISMKSNFVGGGGGGRGGDGGGGVRMSVCEGERVRW